jgi:glycerophosphoryl diester phosphodiesterase
VWVWTLRGENAFLPPALRRGPRPDGAGDLGSLVAEACALEVEGLVTDEPARVAAALSLQS